MQQSDFLRGGLDLAILAGLAVEDSYGYGLITQLRSAGLDEVGDASVYGGLKRLRRAGLLSSRLVVSGAGPARRYYRLTAKGRQELARSIEQWRALRDALDSLIDTSQRG